MARRINIGLNQGPTTLWGSPGKYGILRPQTSLVRVGTGSATQRYTPGHYVALSAAQQGTRPSDVTYIGIPNAGTTSNTGPVCTGIKAVVVRHRWVEINPTGSTYDWTRLDNEIAQCGSFSPTVQLFVVIVVRTFTGTAASENPLPADLVAYSETFSTTSSGWQAWRWSPTILNRFNTLCVNIGNRYNGNVLFGGIATQETSTGSAVGGSASTYTVGGYTGQDLYTPSGYILALKEESDSIVAACPSARQLYYFNFLSGVSNAVGTQDLEDVAAYVQGNGAILGGPDLVVGGNITTRCYPIYKDYHNGTHVSGPTAMPGTGPTFCAVQSGEWSNTFPGDTPTCSVQTRFNYATGVVADYGSGVITPPLNLDIVVWDWHTVNSDSTGFGPQTFNPNARTIIQANPTFGTWSP